MYRILRRLFLGLATLAVFPPACSFAETRSSAYPPPNVILMLADDMGLGDTSAYQDLTGNTDDEQISTPNMKRLARMGVRFSDAHTPASRCTLTRYSLLTGRYSWRNRMKHWVLFGAQGDPMIESDRPTIGTLFQKRGYQTGIVGKWHVGLRYRQNEGQPAAGWKDADLRKPLFDTPLDHGFDFARYTSRSHATSGPSPGGKKKRNDANQSIGPGHLHGRVAIGATNDGKRIASDGERAYVLENLGSRHLANAKTFIRRQVESNKPSPFFLYYACNSNHAPYTPEKQIEGHPVAGAAKSVSNAPLGERADFIHENDVVLGSLIDYLQSTDDPLRSGHKLIENTIVIFSSDNGAEITAKTATGPYRSNKGSVYEGGHRVPFIVSWPLGNVGDGNSRTAGTTNPTLLGLQDMYSTFAEILNIPETNFAGGEKGGEDSSSVLKAWKGATLNARCMFFNDHKEAKDHAVVAFRADDPYVDNQRIPGKWKIFFDAQLLRNGNPKAVQLFNLQTDPKEQHDLLQRAELQPLVTALISLAEKHRTSTGHKLVPHCEPDRFRLTWLEGGDEAERQRGAAKASFSPMVHNLRELAQNTPTAKLTYSISLPNADPVEFTIHGALADGSTSRRFDINARGLGITGGQLKQVDSGEKLHLSFSRDVLIESVSIIAGLGACGGFYRKSDQSPMAIYCVDADLDSNEQQGMLSDIGVLRAHEVLILDSSPHHGVEPPGKWRLADIRVRLIKKPGE